MYLCNIFGDETKNAVSYRQFRKIIDKKYSQGNDEFKLDPLDNGMTELLDGMREQRNWAHHIPQSLFASQENYMVKNEKVSKELFGKLFSDENIYVSVWEYHEIEWLKGLYDSAKDMYEDFKKVFQRMKKDYSTLIGSHMRVCRSIEPYARPFDFTRIAEDSFKANSRRR